ncbi:MAG: Rrf2 family transcriptional regulator [Planctomycetes bacterium]|nr:Rrf2 family transcriptional regulator [Planctomycetota bacterium]
MFSQTVEYAMRAMVHLATLAQGEALTSEVLAERTKVPRGYLSKVMRDLVLADLVLSQRGPSGGFTLARPPSHISMLEVVSAVDPLHRIKECPLGNPAHVSLCPLHRRLDDAIGMIEREFNGTSLAEVLESRPERSCRALTVAVKAPRRGKRD